MHRGYIKVWRKLKDSGLLQLHSTLAMFMYMLIEASHRKIKFGTINLERGQLISGRNKLANDLNLTEQKVRTCLEHLHELEMITSESTNRYTIYTIVNYDIYQDSEDIDSKPNNQQITNKQPTDNQQITTIQTHKNTRTKEDKFVLPDWINKEDWELWIVSRGKKMVDKQKEAQVKKLKKWKDSGLDYADSLKRSAENGWQGLFEPKGIPQKTIDISQQANPPKRLCNYPGCDKMRNVETSDGPRCTEHMYAK